MFTNKQLVEYCEKVHRAGWVYWYGTVGYRCTESLYQQKKRQYPGHYTAARAAGYQRDISAGKWCADCVGLIKSFFWSNGVFEGPSKYGSNHCPDTSANGMIGLCKETGPISTIPDVPGLVVWKSGHIGVYVGGGYTIEMRGFDYDCVRRRVKDGPWVKWGRLPASMLSYDGNISASDTATLTGVRTLKNGCEGEDVRQLQVDLIALGYDCGKWGTDGDFGDATQMAVESFQEDHDLPVTGIVNDATRDALAEALKGQATPDAPDDDARMVQIIGGNCYVRTAPNTEGMILGVARDGQKLPYQGQISENGWHLIEYKEQNGWVSGKYSKVVSR